MMGDDYISFEYSEIYQILYTCIILILIQVTYRLHIAVVQVAVVWREFNQKYLFFFLEFLTWIAFDTLSN